MTCFRAYVAPRTRELLIQYDLSPAIQDHLLPTESLPRTKGMLLISRQAGASYHPAASHVPTSTLSSFQRPHSPMEWSLSFHRWKRHIKPMNRRDKRQRPKKITRGNSTVVSGDKADCGQRRELQEVAGLAGAGRGKISRGQVSMGTG